MRNIQKHPEETTGIALDKPVLWESAIMPGRKVAVSVRDVQLLFRSRHGAPGIDTARQFLLYCAGYGVDPRTKEAYLIPFEVEYNGRKYVKWEMGLAYQIYLKLAVKGGEILGYTIKPDPSEWPREYPGDDFQATIIIRRKPPLDPLHYTAYLGSVVKRYKDRIGGSWSEDRVGWHHMFQVTLLRRAFRIATGLTGYAPEEFGVASGEPTPEYRDIAEQVEFAPMPSLAQTADTTTAGGGAEYSEPMTVSPAEAPQPSQETAEGADMGGNPSPPPNAAQSENTGEIEGAEDAPTVCPNCGKPLKERTGKYGRFLGCSGYPKCRYVYDLEGDAKKPENASSTPSDESKQGKTGGSPPPAESDAPADAEGAEQGSVWDAVAETFGEDSAVVENAEAEQPETPNEGVESPQKGASSESGAETPQETQESEGSDEDPFPDLNDPTLRQMVGHALRDATEANPKRAMDWLAKRFKKKAVGQLDRSELLQAAQELGLVGGEKSA